MEIKFRNSFSELNGNYFTDSNIRNFMKANTEIQHKATLHNINFYKLESNDMLVHVYDAYEVE